MGMVKVYHSDQTGAPVLNGMINSLIEVMDAVLVHGFNEVDVSSITRSGSTVTVQTVGPHGYNNPALNGLDVNGIGNVCLISGAEQPEYNGEWYITYIDEERFSFDIGSLTPDSPATGEIKTRRAPGGFAKPFEAQYRAVYRSTDPTSRQHFLAVNDTADCPNNQGAAYASWRGFERMTGIDTFEYPFPSIQYAAWGEYFCKSSEASAAARAWTIITDGKFIFFWVSPHSNSHGVNNQQRLYGFGDFLTPAPDPYATLISCDTSSSTSSSASANCGLMAPSQNYVYNSISGTGWTCIARRYNGVARPVWAAGLLGHSMGHYGAYVFGQVRLLDYPNPYDNNFYLVQVKVMDGGVLRGVLPMYESLHGLVHSPREIITNVKGLEGRHFICLRAYPSNISYAGAIYIDITGPWS